MTRPKLSGVQASAPLRAFGVHPAVSFAVKHKTVRDALIAKGLATLSYVPLSPREGLSLTEAGVRIARGDE